MARAGREAWPEVDYERWSATCDTLHAHTQVLGKISAVLAPPQPQLQHAALRVTPRGWETAALPAPDGSGAVTVGLDLRAHEAFVDHSDGSAHRIALAPGRSVGSVTRAVLAAFASVAGAVEIDPRPQEVWWSTPLDEDDEHVAYEPAAVARYHAAATRAALLLAAFRAPYRGRMTPVNAWWGSFDLAVNLFSGEPADPPSKDFIMRNAMDSQEIAVGWWPGDPNHPTAGFYAYAHPAPAGFAAAPLPVGRWDEHLREYLLDWSAIRTVPDPQARALEFARAVFRHGCTVCEWRPELLASAEAVPPPIR